MTNTTNKKILITTAIDYTNDVIHIGHAYEKILADAVARFYRLKLGSENVYFLTGVDVHGTTNEKAAKAKGISPIDHVTDIANKDKEQIDALQVSYNRFILTNDPDHEKIASDFFAKAVETGDVYKDTYQGYYCEGCESHKTLSELTEDKQCPLHTTRQIQLLNEENYFFKLSKYTDFLTKLIQNSDDFLLPENRKKEMLAFLNNGLLDTPVSRPKTNVSWGIQTPTDPNQVIYVWYDALINYYTAGIQNGFWDDNTEIIHFVGKDICRFHSLLWPAMLKDVHYKLPDTIYAHGFINLNGEKISKSKGNVIRPTDLINQYGSDAVRYYFLRFGPIVEDVNVSLDHFKEVYNADLANGLGNAVARVAKLAENSGITFAPDTDATTSELFDESWSAPLANFRVDLTIQNIWARLTELDKHITENTPWAIKDQEKLKPILEWEINEIRVIAKCVEPFIPETSKKIQSQFKGQKIAASAPLFPRLV